MVSIGAMRTPPWRTLVVSNSVGLFHRPRATRTDLSMRRGCLVVREFIGHPDSPGALVEAAAGVLVQVSRARMPAAPVAQWFADQHWRADPAVACSEILKYFAWRRPSADVRSI